jgi:shikimate kinase
VKIYLVGFMGAGKTTVGRELARRIGYPFFDLDELVETAEEMTIKEIFAEMGEPHFRRREHQLLRATLNLEHGVVATGGGTFCFEENIELIRGNGLTVYLSAPFALVLSRISDKAAERPLFRDEVATHELYQHRLKYYRAADLTIDIRESETIPEVVERTLIALPKEVFGVPRSGWSSR